MIYVQWHTSIETRLKLFFAHNLCETICNVKGLRIQNYKKKISLNYEKQRNQAQASDQ